MTSLEEFEKRLQAHDWFYGYSDDGRVFDRGHKNEQALLEIAKQSSEHRALYQKYFDEKFKKK